MKLLLVDSLKHFHHAALHQFVLQRRNPKRPQLSVALGNHLTPRRERVVSAIVEPTDDVLQAILQALGVLFLRHTIRAGRAILMQFVEGDRHQLNIEMMKEIVMSLNRSSPSSFRDAIESEVHR